MSKRQFAQNAATLTITSFVLRAIGICFRLYLSAHIGAEGMGLYQLVFSVYVLASTFATSGISIAVTRLVTDELVIGNISSVKRLVSRAVLLSISIGCISAIGIYTAAHPIGVYLLKDIRTVSSLRILGLSLPFMGVTACLRGYFTARRKTIFPSITQMTEQLCRIGLISLFLRSFGHNIESACLGVIAGDGFAEIASCTLMAIGYFIDRKKICFSLHKAVAVSRKRSILSRLLAISAPITIGRYVNSGLRTIENILVPLQLAAFGASTATALSQFGMLKGMALPLLFFPASFLASLSTLLIPELSEAHTLGQKQKVDRSVCGALQIALFLSIWLGGLFTVFSYELGNTLYHSQEVGFLIRVLAPLMPIMYLESIVDGMLKGLNQQVHSLWYGILDSASRILLIWLLVPRHGMAGFLLIMVLSNILTSFLNLTRLLKVTGIRMQWWQWVCKPILAIIFSVFPIYWISSWNLSSSLRLICGGILLTVLYVLFSFMFGILRTKDLRNLQLRRSVS